MISIQAKHHRLMFVPFRVITKKKLNIRKLDYQRMKKVVGIKECICVPILSELVVSYQMFVQHNTTAYTPTRIMATFPIAPFPGAPLVGVGVELAELV